MIRHGLGWAPFWYETDGESNEEGDHHASSVHMLCQDGTHFANCWIPADQMVGMEDPEGILGTCVQIFDVQYPGDIDEHGEPL